MPDAALNHPATSVLPLRLGVSHCLLGEEVRYDGGHKRDQFLVDVLGRYVEWVPVCPEVEAGLGTPREAMRLVQQGREQRLVTIRGNRDCTEPLKEVTDRRLRDLEALDLCGYVFKKDSPSCGIERVRIFNQHGMPSRNGVGLFAAAFMKRFPLVPVEEEGRLCDPVLRENFIERVFCYHRWRMLGLSAPTRRGVVQFHTAHKYLLLAHSREHYQVLGRLVAQVHRYRPPDLMARYGGLFMEALAVKATPRKHVNVLQHLVGHLKDRLSPRERVELDGVILDYHRGLVPLIVPVVLIKHYVALYEIAYIQDQVYLSPHPKELMLRNHV
ncbi:MAG: DUF1722 domain-containing protein [Nitrospiraceae bacterium]|nr:DUF1722 domain-containing protein [Nitrospiraceae bacterium]